MVSALQAALAARKSRAAQHTGKRRKLNTTDDGSTDHGAPPTSDTADGQESEDELTAVPTSFAYSSLLQSLEHAPSGGSAQYKKEKSSRKKKQSLQEVDEQNAQEHSKRALHDSGARLQHPSGEAPVDADNDGFEYDNDASIHLDRFDAHLSCTLTDAQQQGLLAVRSAKYTPLHVVQGSLQLLFPGKVVQMRACVGVSEPFQAPLGLDKYGVKPRLQARFAEVHNPPPSGEAALAAFASRQQAALFSAFNSYADVLHTAMPYSTQLGACAPEEDAAMLHVVNHVVKKMDAVKKNNERIKAKGLDKGDAQDQGFVRPIVLILAPMRVVALSAVLRLLRYAQREAREDSIQGKDRLIAEFGAAADDDAARGVGRQVQRPKDYKALFDGNSDDHFRIGVKVTRGAVKLFTDFYQSDIIVASPLALATRLAENKDDGADFLSSIEVAIVLRADIMLMQNWSHVDTVFASMNKLPKRQHDTDIMRVRPWALNELGRMYRQTVLFSSFASPEFNALFNTFANHAGQLRLTHTPAGVLHQVVPQVRQLFRKFTASSVSDSHDQRFSYFTMHVWPRLKEASPSGLLIFASSYFEFVRLRNFLKSENASLAVYCEYTPGSDVKRARSRFYHGERRIMLYTERAHFYFRPKIRGIKDVVFYSLPQHGHYYAELVNLLDEAGSGEEAHSTVQVMFCEYDILTLSRVVGQKRAKRMLSSSSASFLFT